MSGVMPERFKTRPIKVGDLWMGGDHPLVVQSMVTTDTMNVEATVAQIKDLVQAGCQIVRITAPTVQDAEALKDIKQKLVDEGINVPLVADIHFVPAAAMTAADYVEKIRINPGNFADRKMFKVREYTDDQYQEELDRIHEKFKPLVLKLKSLGRALRIGTNHGSLSDRIMNRFGDTPEGMVESAFEFAEICRTYDFHNFCFSMKASHAGVMVQAYRLLVKRQVERGWNYPIHLGVTEAGDGEDGRLKSSIGIGTLLAEGIGDTIRVSLTEAAVKEIPVCQALVKRFAKSHPVLDSGYHLSSTEFVKTPEVWYAFKSLDQLRADMSAGAARPDVVYVEDTEWNELHNLKLQIKVATGNAETKLAISFPESLSSREQKRCLNIADIICSEKMQWQDTGKPWVRLIKGISSLKKIERLDPECSVLLWSPKGLEGLDRIVEASLQLGTPFVDVGWRGLLIDDLAWSEAGVLGFGILQATRRRMSKTEYISCPSCGRTLFDLEETTARIKELTGHLKGVKIAVMGCIVNGPGEMADADFGYVGGAPGRVNLYVGKDCVERNIPSQEAPARLVDLIKRHNRWIEPSFSQASTSPAPLQFSAL